MRENAESESAASGALWAEAVRFIAVGLACVLFNIALFSILVERGGWSYLAVTVLAFFGVNAMGFVLHRLWTFRATQAPVPLQAVRFLSVQALSLALNLALMWALVDRGKANPVIASVLVSAIFAAGNFLAQRIWIFRH